MYGGGPAHTFQLRLQLGLQACLQCVAFGQESFLCSDTCSEKATYCSLLRFLLYLSTRQPELLFSNGRFTAQNVTPPPRPISYCHKCVRNTGNRLDPICGQDRWAELDQFHGVYQVTVKSKRGSKPGIGPKWAHKSNWARVNPENPKITGNNAGLTSQRRGEHTDLSTDKEGKVNEAQVRPITARQAIRGRK